MTIKTRAPILEPKDCPQSWGSATTHCTRYPALPLAAAFAVLALTNTTRAEAATIAVTNCGDSGPGSLRAAAATAASGDTIDLQALTCRTLLLSSGQIVLPQDDLTLLGRGPGLSIEANQSSRVLKHTGSGTLEIRSLSIAYGKHAAAEAEGGCIDSQGSVVLRHVRVHDCVAQGLGLYGRGDGGGVRAKVSLLLDRSRVFSNSALGEGYGGGVFADELVVYQSKLDGNVSGNVGGGAYCFTLTMTSSVVHGNTAKDGGGLNCPGGNSFIQKSEISGNRATQFSGGLALGGNLNSEVHIVDSTISGNIAHYNSAAILWGSILNSTIALNHELGILGSGCDIYRGFNGALAGGQLYLESSIVAANSCTTGAPIDVGSGAVLTGMHNLIGHSKVRVPPDTLRGRPLLSPLANNGGLTRTRALQAGSPAIDRGSNPLDRLYDQRGPGFPREKGAAVDIGAFER